MEEEEKVVFFGVVVKPEDHLGVNGDGELCQNKCGGASCDDDRLRHEGILMKAQAAIPRHNCLTPIKFRY